MRSHSPEDFVFEFDRSATDRVADVVPWHRHVDRRTVLGYLGSLAVGGLLVACGRTQAGMGDSGSSQAEPQAKQKVTFAFPGPGTLLFLPFEIARAQGFFSKHGLEPEFTYTKGGPPAATLLASGGVDFAGISIDVMLNFSAEGKKLTMVASTTRLPAFALVAAPGQSGVIHSLEDLQGKTVGVANLGAGDQITTQYLLKQAGADPSRVQFAAIGTDQAKVAALESGELDAALVQEPALTRLTGKGARVLTDMYDPEQAKEAFGSEYQFTGLVVQQKAIEERSDVVGRAANAVADASRFIASTSGVALLEGIPDEAVTSGDREKFAKIVDKYKGALYPGDGKVNSEGVETVIRIRTTSGTLKGEAPDPNSLYTNEFLQRQQD